MTLYIIRDPKVVNSIVFGTLRALKLEILLLAPFHKRSLMWDFVTQLSLELSTQIGESRAT